MRNNQQERHVRHHSLHKKPLWDVEEPDEPTLVRAPAETIQLSGDEPDLAFTCDVAGGP